MKLNEIQRLYENRKKTVICDFMKSFNHMASDFKITIENLPSSKVRRAIGCGSTTIGMSVFPEINTVTVDFSADGDKVYTEYNLPKPSSFNDWVDTLVPILSYYTDSNEQGPPSIEYSNIYVGLDLRTGIILVSIDFNNSRISEFIARAVVDERVDAFNTSLTVQLNLT